MALECFCRSLKQTCTFLLPLPLEKKVKKPIEQSYISQRLQFIVHLGDASHQLLHRQNAWLRTRVLATKSSNPNSNGMVWQYYQKLSTIEIVLGSRRLTPPISSISFSNPALFAWLPLHSATTFSSSDVPFFLSFLLPFLYSCRPHSFFWHIDTLRTQIPNSRPSTLFSKYSIYPELLFEAEVTRRKQWICLDNEFIGRYSMTMLSIHLPKPMEHNGTDVWIAFGPMSSCPCSSECLAACSRSKSIASSVNRKWPKHHSIGAWQYTVIYIYILYIQYSLFRYRLWLSASYSVLTLILILILILYKRVYKCIQL